MGKQVTLKAENSHSVWHRLNMAWAAFFFLMGVLNLYIAFEYSEETWVNFKLFGSTGLLVAFVIAQGVWLSRHMEHPPE
jgi:intracellular septation protein